MRTIDADALCEEFKRRQRAALRWKEEAILADNEESKIRADAVLAFLSEVKLTIDNAPTLEQPIDEWCTDCKEYDKEKNCCPRFNKVIRETLKDAQPTGEWIPVKYRPLTEKERIEFTEHYGSGYCDEIDGIFDCPMPEDGQEILVSGSWGVSTDVAEIDVGFDGFNTYGLEGNGDWDGIVAWMPLPEPYKKGGEEE